MSTWRPSSDGDDLPQPIGKTLDRVARRFGAPRASALAAVFDRWEEAVGAAMAAHARPLSLRNGTLVVAVDEPGWATQLRYLSADLVRRLAEVAGDGVVTAVDVRVKPRSREG